MREILLYQAKLDLFSFMSLTGTPHTKVDLLILHKPLLRPALVVWGPELRVHLKVLELPFAIELDILF